MKRRALGPIFACAVTLIMVLEGVGIAGYFLGYEEMRYKRAVLGVCLEVVSPSLRDYMTAFHGDALAAGFSHYSKETDHYQQLRTKDGLEAEIDEVYRLLRVRLEPEHREQFHYNNVTQLGIMADLVLRYVGYTPGTPIFVRWKGVVIAGDDPAAYLNTLGYGSADVDTAVNAVANLWLSAWGDAEGAQTVGYSVHVAKHEKVGRTTRTGPFISGGTYEPIGPQEKAPCPQPYIDSIYPRSAVVGDTILIRGARFGTERGQVMFPPGVSAEVLDWGYRKLEVIVPEGAASGSVTVKVPCGAVSNGKYFGVTAR